MNKYMKFSMLLIVFTVFFSLSQKGFSFENVLSLPQNQANTVEQAVPMGHFGPCYSWAWSFGTLYHHHVYWAGWGWDHTYAQAVWVYHSFFQRYVWQCTWLGCNAIHF